MSQQHQQPMLGENTRHFEKRREDAMKRIAGLRVALAQMHVLPGRPDSNAEVIIREIQEAAKQGADLIVFPELATTGYLIGDIFEDDAFVQDVKRCNRRIIDAVPDGITAVFGTVDTTPGARGEDGRQRLHNAAMTTSGGELLGRTFKTLQPNYRFFNDDKHFFSMRNRALEEKTELVELLQPLSIQTTVGTLQLGVMLCEDMWHLDYAQNPAQELVRNGAELLVNLSASPWTWRKNEKRHRVVRELLDELAVPFVYVNRTGVENVGGNVVVYDGSSAVYGQKGDVLSEIEPFSDETLLFTLRKKQRGIEPRQDTDTQELYRAMTAATNAMVPPTGPVIVGLSGGIDSSVVAAHLVDVLGPERVVGINMPSTLNSDETKTYAKTLAERLGIEYRSIPIGKIVDAITEATDATTGTLTHQNIQARARQEVLAATAQQLGGVFTCNANKVEIAFGYGTLYGDIAGFYAPLGDLVKREVRQIARYLNEECFGREVIQEKAITQRPTAELEENQYDPYDYGYAGRRGYHDELVRAFTEFRRNPEWVLRHYAAGTLAREMRLDQETLSNLFANARAFVEDLEHQWRMYHRAYFKRIQAPPIPVYSRRAFGRDLEESVLSAHFTEGYWQLRATLLKERIAVFGGSFNPPAWNHRAIIQALVRRYDTVVVVPCGIRKDKASTRTVSLRHRKAMIEQDFWSISGVLLDWTDLDADVFTPTAELARRYAEQYPDAEIFFAVGPDIVGGGAAGESEIQKFWVEGERIWENLNFAVISAPNETAQAADLPPCSELVELTEPLMERSTLIRERIANGETVEMLVSDDVLAYIEKYQLYR